MGANGTGKTILSSYIGDLFIEIGRKVFDNVVNKENAYFRVVGGTNIGNYEKYAYTIISFNDNNNDLTYIVKSNEIEFNKEKSLISNFSNNSEIERVLKKDNNQKEIILLNDGKKIFDNNILISFASYRSEKPNWMNQEAISYNEEYASKGRVNRKLYREIFVEQTESKNGIWLERLLMDSMIHVISAEKNNEIIVQRDIKDIEKNLKIVGFINKIISKVLKKPSRIVLNPRTSSIRISINTIDGFIPALNNLSLGQSILFNMFITILRHADEVLKGDISDLSKLNGIVSIDEVDMHLDTEMQYSILPELISMFPNIQFIITSHSPLFVLGMKNRYGDDCDFIEMPNGNNINVENFNEFKLAYDYIKNTNKFKHDFEKELKSYVEKNNDNDYIVITEGYTDWIHMKNAYIHLLKQDKFKNKFGDLNFKFYEYKNDNNLNMGDSHLKAFCESSSIISRGKFICIFDRDRKDIINKVTEKGTYKSWGNGVFSFAIPCPETRSDTPNISIEHYYNDQEIKRKVKCDDGVYRRLFMGCEFFDAGVSLDKMYTCRKLEKCGVDKINIIDGENESKVYKIDDLGKKDRTNYALSKMNFAKSICDDEIKISKRSYNNFILIFEEIKNIIENN